MAFHTWAAAKPASATAATDSGPLWVGLGMPVVKVVSGLPNSLPLPAQFEGATSSKITETRFSRTKTK